MIDIWLLVLILIVGMVVAIEGLPDGFGKKAKTFAMALAAVAKSMIKRVASTIIIVAKRIGYRIRQSRSFPIKASNRQSQHPVFAL